MTEQCNLRWRELLSQEEIRSWVHSGRAPKRLSELAYAGVYRFVFPEARDGGSAHTPCYVGEAGKISERLPDHFVRHGPDKERQLEKSKLPRVAS